MDHANLAAPPLPAGTICWILGSGLIGHETHCVGVARELGLDPVLKRVPTSGIFAALSPYGPIDPAHAPGRAGSVIEPPFPDIAIASGRKTVPYLRRLRSAARGRVFTIFLQNPGVGAGMADVIWVPEHDRLRGDNVVVTLTSPHPMRPALLEAARHAPDPRIARLPGPRAALILGGPSAHHSFTPADNAALANIARDLLAQGFSVMATPSRRTVPETFAALREVLATARDRSFLWGGEVDGPNPYPHMIANADALVVTGDSVNMVGEALATTAPVYLYEPTGGHPKVRVYLDRLLGAGLVRRWEGRVEDWRHDPVDATSVIATEIARHYAAFRS